MKSLISLAVALTVIPTVHALATTPPPPPAGASPDAAVSLTGATTAHPQELVARVTRLTDRARSHARRLGLATGRIGRIPARPELLERREARLQAILGFLEEGREVRLAVDERPRPAAAPRGRTPGARVVRAHSLAVQRSLRLGLAHPGRLDLAPTREGRLAQLARWRAVASWLGARQERVRPRERPLSERIPHYDELTCIAEHESHGTWDISTGNGYYGGLQMDRSFQQTYAPGVYRAKGTADNWTQEEQMRAAERAIESRGFSPWPNTARMCGLL